ncbi:MAG: TonB-dependent receptor [Rheinheimera sp.]|nr:TonB-dependent receptor [Rheinheimera sp.]
MTDSLQLNAALTLNRSLYAEDVFGVAKNAAGQAVRIIDYKQDQEVAGSPKQMTSVGLVYEQQWYHAGINLKRVGSYCGAAKHTFVNNNSVWNRDEIPASTLWDLYFGYRKDLVGDGLVKSLELNFLINNLTDQAPYYRR